MLVPFDATHVGFDYFDGSGEGGGYVSEGLADAVEHEPGGCLPDAEVAVESHRGDTFEGCEFEVDGPCPQFEGKLGVFHGGAGFEREVLEAGAAAVGHGLAGLDSVCVV